MTDNGIAYIDPHEEIYREDRDKGRPTSSYKWNMDEDYEDMQDFPEQWEPFFHDIFGFSQQALITGR